MDLVSYNIIEGINELLNDGQVNRTIKVFIDKKESKITFVIGNGSQVFSRKLPRDEITDSNINEIYKSLFTNLWSEYENSKTRVLDLVDRTSFSYPDSKVIGFLINDIGKNNEVIIFLDDYTYGKEAIEEIIDTWLNFSKSKTSSSK